MTHLAVLTTHPVQYYAPLFRELAGRLDLTVFYAHHATQSDQARAGFGAGFDWDIDLLTGYRHITLRNVAQRPGPSHYGGCDTPEVGRHLREGRFDALLTLGWHVKSLQQGIVAAKRLGLPVMVRGDSQLAMPTGPARRTLKAMCYPALLRLFDVALAVGQRNRAFYRHYGYPDERIVLSPHAVDTETFHRAATAGARRALRARLGIAEDTPLILFCGKLVPFKRPGDVVEAVAQLRAQQGRAEMLVAGAGELQPQLTALATARSVPLHLLGFVNQSRIAEVYAAADVLVLPSTGRETWGLVANEALASGCPVVLSDAVGSAADLDDGAAGRSYICGDSAALAGALNDVLNEPPSPAAIAALSRRFTLARAADGIQAGLGVTRAPAIRRATA